MAGETHARMASGLRLLKKPVKAGWHPIIRFSYSGPAYEAWQNFLEPAF